MSRDECAAASPRWGNGGGSCTCSGHARPAEPAVFDSSRCPVHAKPPPEARSAATPCVHEWEYDEEESKGPWTGYIERCSLCGALQQVPQ